MSTVVPLAVLTGSLLVSAWRERSAGLAFVAGQLVNFTATAAWISESLEPGVAIFPAQMIELFQFNIAVAAGFAIAWLLARVTRRRRGGAVARPVLLEIQLALLLVANLLLILPATVWLVARPDAPTAPQVAVGSQTGWLAMALTAAALAGVWLRSGAARGIAALFLIWTAATAMAGVTLSVKRPDLWVGFHVLPVAQATAVWLMLGAGRLADRTGRGAGAVAAAAWMGVAALLVVLLAVRARFGDPQGPWWSIGTLATTAVAFAMLAGFRRRGAYLFATAGLFNLAATFWWLSESWTPDSPRRPGAWVDLVLINIVALAATGAASALMKIVADRRRRPWDHAPLLHRIAAPALLGTLGAAVASGLFADAFAEPIRTTAPVPWLAAGALALLIVTTLWDRAVRAPAMKLFLLGVVAIGIAMDAVDQAAPWMRWTAAVSLSIYALAAAILWRTRRRWRPLRIELGMPVRRLRAIRWLGPGVTVIGAIVVVLAFYVTLTFHPENIEQTVTGAAAWRLAAAAAGLLLAGALALLGGGAGRADLRRSALLVATFAAIGFAWAFMTPTTAAEQLLDRATIVLVVSAAAGAVCVIGLGRLAPAQSPWPRDGRSLLPWQVGLGAASMAFIFAVEVTFTITRSELDYPVPMSGWAIAAVVAALGAGIAAALVLAVVPGRDPLRLPEARRMGYVYGAEVLAAAMFLHVRLTMPWIFRGFFVAYWPLIVMFIAFAGVGLSELFRNRKLFVLARPLERTGAFLPLLPVLGFWALGSRVNYSGLLLIVGVLYGVLAVMRRAFGFGVLAALAANGGLWFFLKDTDNFRFWQHPQLWLIPPALCVLAAAHLNRRNLNEAQMTSVRYICLLLVYISSTADIFIRGVGESALLPMILALLSVAGALAGILLRVRSFLFAGTAFLLLALISMIWHAAASYQMTWLWYVAGICLGSAIIAMFAVFEKKRPEMLAMVENLKGWQR